MNGRTWDRERVLEAIRIAVNEKGAMVTAEDLGWNIVKAAQKHCGGLVKAYRMVGMEPIGNGRKPKPEAAPPPTPKCYVEPEVRAMLKRERAAYYRRLQRRGGDRAGVCGTMSRAVEVAFGGVFG